MILRKHLRFWAVWEASFSVPVQRRVPTFLVIYLFLYLFIGMTCSWSTLLLLNDAQLPGRKARCIDSLEKCVMILKEDYTSSPHTCSAGAFRYTCENRSCSCLCVWLLLLLLVFIRYRFRCLKSYISRSWFILWRKQKYFPLQNKSRCSGVTTSFNHKKKQQN